MKAVLIYLIKSKTKHLSFNELLRFEVNSSLGIYSEYFKLQKSRITNASDRYVNVNNH